MEYFSDLVVNLQSSARLYIVFLLTMFINLINTLVRCSRLSGVRTGHLATAISLFGIIFLAASFANTLQAPLLASTVESRINEAAEQAKLADPDITVINNPIYQKALAEVNQQLRFVICGATVGTVLGMALIPSFVTTFINIINAFSRVGSVFRLIPLLFFSDGKQERIRLVLRFSSWGTLRELLSKPMITPKTFLYWSAFSYSVWTVNVLSGLYAAALFPDYKSVAAASAAVLGNAAIVLNVMMVDPILAKVTDGVASGVQGELELKQIVFYLSLANLFGTLLSQLLFMPVAQLLLKMAIMIKGFI